MEDKTKDARDALLAEVAIMQKECETVSIQDEYKTEDAAKADAEKADQFNFKSERLRVMKGMMDHYSEKYKGCRADVFYEPPFDNCSLFGYEKHFANVTYYTYKVKKTQVLVNVGYKATVSTTSNSVNVREEGDTVDIYYLEGYYKTVKCPYFVRVMKEDNEKQVKLNDATFDYIDVKYFNKSKEKTTGLKLYNIFNYVNLSALLASFIMILLQTIGCNFVIGRLISKGKLASLSEGLVNFSTSPVLKIILLSCIGIYFVSYIGLLVTTKYYNNCISSRDFSLLKNIPTQIVNFITMLLVFSCFMLCNSVSCAYCSAPGFPYGEASGLFSGLGFVKKFAEIAHLESTRAFTFASHADAAIYLAGVTISFCELVGMLYVIAKMVFTILKIVALSSDMWDIEKALTDRAKLTDKKIEEYAKNLKEFNENIMDISDADLYPSTIKRIPSIFDSKSNLRESKKIKQLQNGKFNPARFLALLNIIPIMGIVFFVFDGIHDLCVTGFFPGSNVVKYFGYVVLMAISFGITYLATKFVKALHLDD